ncbi:hypothetical protein [Gilvimarinus xylanilyticus]|uniref:Glycosyl transferase family 8 n=1 Tax=Gilvimarinus xylanilyticus TaxID=2944139 RepID=A0A9X2KV81_9GAMM|nr:hypothetical protein [Gilvimarinus xylanilyticus]MCP8900927.1 hypothetical protein [Gilvimarinus xylanilyticus]
MKDADLNILLLTFGDNIQNHYQACFCILSLLKENPVPRITLYTDVPEFYRMFSAHISIVEISSQTLKRWQGSAEFFWRIKCMAVLDMTQRYPGEHIVYVDSDTFCAGGLDELQQGLQEGRTFMHLCEGNLSNLNTKTTRSMWQALKYTEHQGVSIRARTQMWNAGLIALPATIASSVADHSVAVCDSLCTTRAPRKLLEQFAFSLALNHAVPLQPADQWVGHYWGNKPEWNNVITQFFLRSKMHSHSVEDDIEALRNFSFAQVPLYRKVPAANARLKRWADYLFSARDGQRFTLVSRTD